MAKILILGDLHAGPGTGLVHLVYVQTQALKKFPDITHCIQVGDFGFYGSVFKNLKGTDKLPIKTFVIDGNHEDHEWLKEANVTHGAEWQEKYNFTYKPRGTIEVFDGATVGFFGGALNVDRAQEGSIDRRTTNYPLRVEVAEAIVKFNSVPKIDLMITHSCPHSIGVGMVGNAFFFESIDKFCHRKGHSTGPNHDCGEGALTRLWTGLTTKPDNWAYGHFHQTRMKKVNNTYFYCVGSTDSSDGKDWKEAFIYDTDKKTIEYHNAELGNFHGMHRTRLR